MDEIALMLAAQKGDLEAFNRLVLAYQQIAFNLAYRLLSDSFAAEDATQTAFLSAYRNIASYRGGSCRAWFLRIVTNTCYDELRRRKRRPTTPLMPYEDDSDEEIESPAWLADGNPGPENQTETAELDQAIQRCIDDLPEEFRSVIIMVDIEGFNYQEVSDAIQKPLGTVKSRVARARLKLKDCLQNYRELLPNNYRLEEESDS
ncbi:MAG: sigma-70 family RNA polymerase sigma factor [Chloroflexi bacterium]|nr:sigma-70 family RNA polymerase sigma factor [Anaerolineaceae bacterium]NMB88843.1 sigma-70 family RNA polymerase sigma factor [Chloroflexota bacterium]